MPKFFVCSDIHSAYTPWMKALEDAGFDENDNNHKLIICGDLFDRMGESQQVYKFTRDMLDSGKIIYIKGNHEQLLEDCLLRGYSFSYDHTNGTCRTIRDLGRGEDFEEFCNYTLKKVRPLLDNTVNYFETKNYIFVHSWIPTLRDEALPAYYTRETRHEFNPNWRNASQREWDDATWGNPFDMAEKGLNQTGKVIIFGHWHASTGWARAEGRSEFGDDAKFEPYYGDGFIAIDSCVARSGKCNVIVIEDEFLEEEDVE